MTECQIITIFKEVEAGISAREQCRKCGIASSMFYKWRSKYGGIEVLNLKRLKELEEEKRKIKQMYADLSIES